MLKNPLARCVFRLLTLAVMLGVTALVSTDRAQAVVDESCESQYGYCIYSNCMTLTGAAYTNCRFNCESLYQQCQMDPNYDPLPAPYPVITNDLQWCLQSCQPCTSIEDVYDRLACYIPCWEWCMENNPKP